MTLTKQQAKENLAKLINKFEVELASGQAREYNEEATKTAFIQPLLKDVLGWDVNDNNEVSPEVRVSRGRVDYGLKAGGKIRMFVEAKPIKADLDKHIEQAVRYGYNRRDVPFVLLTDFEGVKLFDVTFKPDLRNLKKGLKIDLDYKDYLVQFDKLWLFSKESVESGELDKLLLKKPKDRQTVDKAILADLENWREKLAKDIYKNNPHLFHSQDLEKDSAYLKEITQKLLDRIIFMRFCEDRKLTHRNNLRAIFEERTDAVGPKAMLFLAEEFKDYSRVYNSDLFAFKDWEEKLQIDFKVMKEIILEMYNPYQFDVIPLEVLGSIYEQYLGYTARLTEHQVKYELKMDVRKAGGVYYTPEYIVDYIIKNTVGKLLTELPPSKIKKLRILDPACGSGSFLIRAYEEMLNYYKQQKINKRKHSSSLPVSFPQAVSGNPENAVDGELALNHEQSSRPLSIQEKANILKEHIFGVDIDEQAVEVTKLSLMLKMLEDEYGFVPGRAVLPMLDGNIKCGNSLISGSTLELKKYFGDDYYKVKPFNWEERFPAALRDGGFDVVIGNPPYVFTRETITNMQRAYFSEKYSLSWEKQNTYMLFMEKLIQLINKTGIASFIVPNSWLTMESGKLLRSKLIPLIQQIVDINYPVFYGVSMEPCIFFINSKQSKNRVQLARVKNLAEMNSIKYVQTDIKRLIKQNIIVFHENISISNLIDRVLGNTKSLGTLFDIRTGLQAYEKGKGNPQQTAKDVENHVFDRKKYENKYSIKYFEGKDITRYGYNWSGMWMQYGIWLSQPRDLNIFTRPRILLREITGKEPYCLNFTYIDKQFLNNKSILNILDYDDNSNRLKLLVALLNSRFISFYYKKQAVKSCRNVFPKVVIKDLHNFPIPAYLKEIAVYKEQYEQTIEFVDIMLDLNNKLQSAKGSEKEQIQQQITQTEREIDELVYKLYGLTKEEIKIVEES